MNSTDIPSRLSKAFAVNGLKNTLPVDSSTSTDSNGVATYDKGFPPITMQPPSAGGLPPNGKDMNGVLYSATQQLQWANAGMGYPFSQDFSTAVSGYPKGATIPNANLSGQWLNLVDGNTNTPDASGASTTGWVPVANYGVTQLSGLSASSVILSANQAAKDRIILSGTLTSNITITFPAWIKAWQIENNCTGNFTVTCKTSSSVGVIVPNGILSFIYCDGTGISKSFGSASLRDVGTGDGQVPDMSSFQSSLQWSKSANGKITQTSTISTTTAGNNVFSFPIPFPTACRSIVCQQQDTNQINIIGCIPISNSQFRISAWQWNGNGFGFTATSVTYIAQGD
ncbi:gp53-like domain-containing protein [Pantoea stewartii subsp. indologenes]|uniref:gp53-like domain-containing protein n=1 Tax=Pantoea stewartii TaxID=66269 RepID=UPI003FA45546